MVDLPSHEVFEYLPFSVPSYYTVTSRLSLNDTTTSRSHETVLVSSVIHTMAWRDLFSFFRSLIQDLLLILSTILRFKSQV